MEQDFKKAVAVFGLVLPVLLIVALIVAVIVGKGRVTKTYKTRQAAYQQSQMQQKQLQLLRQKVAQEKEVLESWEALLAKESRRSFTQHWKEVGQSFKSREFQLELPTWQNQSSGLGQGHSQPASQVSMNFDATFRAMQIALLKMETRLPQMQLDSISMKLGQDGQTLNFQTQFTVWTAN